MDISIIYVNWNSEDFIKESIDSVYEHTHGLEFEIIVVDNASPSGNVGMLKEHFPQITLIKSEKNLGFAGANNLGFQNSIGEIVLFLNPDTKLVNPAIDVIGASSAEFAGWRNHGVQIIQCGSLRANQLHPDVSDNSEPDFGRQCSPGPLASQSASYGELARCTSRVPSRLRWKSYPAPV